MADRDNHGFLGPASGHALAEHTAHCHGASASNRDCVLQLATALREIDEEDPPVLILKRLLTIGTHAEASQS